MNNRGVAGVDRITLARVEEYGVKRMLDELAADLRAGIYRPALVRGVQIPKPDGGGRSLGIPTVRDRVVQQAAKLVLEPIFETTFEEGVEGYVPYAGNMPDALNSSLAKIRATMIGCGAVDLPTFRRTARIAYVSQQSFLENTHGIRLRELDEVKLA